jgi:MFS family permease
MENEKRLPLRWIIVGVSFSTLALTYTVMYSFSVFFVALLKEFGWSRSVTAGAFSLFWIVHGIVSPFIGNLVDRWGARWVFLIGSLLLGIGLALCSWIDSWWQLYLFYSVISAIGVGSTPGGFQIRRSSRIGLRKREDWPWESSPQGSG